MHKVILEILTVFMKYHVLQNCAFLILEVIRLIYCSVWLLSPAKVEMARSLKDMKNTVEELASLVQASSYKISLTSE